MSGKWGITGYVVLSVITWGLATEPPLGKMKYFMNLMYVHKCASLIKWYFKMPYISPKKKPQSIKRCIFSLRRLDAQQIMDTYRIDFKN